MLLRAVLILGALLLTSCGIALDTAAPEEMNASTTTSPQAATGPVSGGATSRPTTTLPPALTLPTSPEVVAPVEPPPFSGPPWCLEVTRFFQVGEVLFLDSSPELATITDLRTTIQVVAAVAPPEVRGPADRLGSAIDQVIEAGELSPAGVRLAMDGFVAENAPLLQEFLDAATLACTGAPADVRIGAP